MAAQTMEGTWVPECLGEELPCPQPHLGWLDTDMRETDEEALATEMFWYCWW